MRYHGREIDAVALWGEYVEFPHNMDSREHYLPKVRCPNPEHSTDKRHFQVNTRDGLVHCFAECGISGNYEHAIALIEGCTKREARRKILKFRSSERSPLTFRGRGRTKVDNPILTTDLSEFSFIPQAPLEYLESRGVSGASIARWELGWNSDSMRITIPARDMRGRLRFVIERTISEKQHLKYLYPEGVFKSSLLFGGCQIDLPMIRSMGIVLVEGSLDTILLHQRGFPNAVGILGSKISVAQARMVAALRPKRIYTMFDKDGTGVTATLSVRERVSGIPTFVCLYPKGKSDPAELTRKEAARVIERAVPYVEFKSRIRNLSSLKEAKKVG